MAPTGGGSGRREFKLMGEWIDQGVELGWLFDVQNRRTFIYRADGSISTLDGFDRSLVASPSFRALPSIFGGSI